MSKNIFIISKYAITPNLGEATRQFYIAKSLAELNYNISLISSRSSDIKNNIKFKKLFLKKKIGNIEHILINGPLIKLGFSFKRIWSWFVFEFYLRKYLKKHNKIKPDVVIVSSLSLLTILNGLYLKRKYKSKLIFEIRDIWPLTITELGNYSTKHPFVYLLSLLEKLAYNKADYITATMPKADLHIKKIIKKDFNFKCIPQGINLDFYSNLAKLDNGFIQQYIPENKFIIGYAGAIGISNSLDVLINASKKIEEINKNIHFLIIGEGALKNNFIEQTKNQKNISFLPKIDKNKINHFLKHCDITFDSVKNIKLYNYGLSRNKWMDYMYAEKPIIASYSGYKSLINKANCGTFVPAEDTNALVNEIIRYSKINKSELDEIGKKGKKYLLENRLFKNLAIQYTEIFNI